MTKVLERPPILPQSPRSLGGQLFRATSVIALMQCLVRGLGMLEKLIVSHFFGTDAHADLYYAARRLSLSFFQLSDQATIHAFLPVFVQRRKEIGETDAWRYASTIMNLFLLLSLVGVGLTCVFTPQLLQWYVPGWMTRTIPGIASLSAHLVFLTRIMMLASVFLVTSSLTYSLLNAHKSFAIPAASDLVLRGSVILCAVFWIPASGIFALVIGFIIGALGKLAFQLWGLKHYIRHYRVVVDWRHPGLAAFGTLIGPLLLGTLVSIARQFLDTRFVSSLPSGSLAALEYAESVCNVPVQLCAMAFAIAIFPFLSDLSARNAIQEIHDLLAKSIRLIVLLTVPMTALLILWREPVLQGLFGSHSFTPVSLALTIPPFVVAALGILIESLEIMILQVFFSFRDTIRPILIGLSMVTIHIGIAYLGIYYYHMGIVAIPLAFLISRLCKVGLLVGYLRSHQISLAWQQFVPTLSVLLLALIPLVGIALWTRALLPMSSWEYGVAAKFSTLFPYIGVGLGGLAVYFGIIQFMRPDDMAPLWRAFRAGLMRENAVPSSPNT